MVQKIRKLSVESINKIKYESREEFDESIFREVYQDASRCVSKIIEDNELLNEKKKDGYSEDEQLSNIVAFIGERGMGKSSAMLSYAYFLRTYNEENAKEFKIKNVGECKPAFSVLPRIDAAMMGKGESILDIILAKMWDDFYERDKRTGKKSNILEGEIKEDFNRVKNTYRNYKRIMSGKELLQDMTSVRELHELAACMNLRSELRKLMEDYLKYGNNKSFLVVCLDDLDMAMGDLYESMEQIRLFLMIPKVIILSTINLSRFMMSCKKYLWERLSCNINMSEDDKRKINHYVKDYMAKILPSNMRINMPHLGMVGGIEYEIELDGYLKCIFRETIPKDVHYDERRLMFTLLASYSDIFFLPYDEEKHFLQDESLRKIVNKLYVLLSILKEKEDDRFEQAYRWYFDKLIEYSQDMSNIELAEKFLKIGNRYINDSIANILLDINGKENIVVKGDDYGDILRYLLLIENNNHREVFNFITLLYSIQICSGLERGVEKIEDICRGNIFNAALRETSVKESGSGSCLEGERSIGRLLNIELFYEEKDGKCLSAADIIWENAPGLMDIFIVANFCGFSLENITYTAEKSQGNTTGTIPGTEKGQERIMESLILKVTDNGDLHTVSIDNFILNILKFEKNLTAYIENIYRAIKRISKKSSQNPRIPKKDLKKILENDVWKYKRYGEWKKKKGISDKADIREILPIQSVELMVHLARSMSRSVKKFIRGAGITFEGLKDEWNGLVSDLSEVEEFCSYNELKGISYAGRLKAYWEMLSPENIDEEIKRKLDVPSEWTPNRQNRLNRPLV